jgi:hypothetical protein
VIPSDDPTPHLHDQQGPNERLRAGVEGWCDPLRLKHGYRIDGAWVIKERNEFVWLLSRVDPDPAQYIAKAERWFLTPVL